MEKTEFRKLFIKVVLVAGIVTFALGMLFIPPAYGAEDGPCTETDTSVKYDALFDGELDAVVLSEGTEFCVKGGTENSGPLVADGETTLLEYIEQAGIRVGKGNVPAVSHYVVYDSEPDPEPSPTPTPTPTPDPTPTPEPEYEPPTATLNSECGVISGTLTSGSEEEWFQLVGPNGTDVWGAALTLDPYEEREFTEQVTEGTYTLYTSPVDPVGSESTLVTTVDVECPVEPTPEPEPTEEPTPVETPPVVEELPRTGASTILLGLAGLSALGLGTRLLRR